MSSTLKNLNDVLSELEDEGLTRTEAVTSISVKFNVTIATVYRWIKTDKTYIEFGDNCMGGYAAIYEQKKYIDVN